MAVKEKQKFERLEMTKEELLEMFKVGAEVYLSTSCTSNIVRPPLFMLTVQQVQADLHLSKSARWNIHDSVSMWTPH